MKKIFTDRLVIRNYRPDDWRDLQEYLAREEVRRFEPHWDSSEQACKEAALEFSQGNVFWAVELPDLGKMIGHVFFAQSRPLEFMTWNLGYVFHPGFYGRGYATEACRGLLQFGFDRWGVHRVVARCDPENTPSWKVLERLGMRREGHSLQCVTRETTPAGTPVWTDEYLYAILQHEWQRFECRVEEAGF